MHLYKVLTELLALLLCADNKLHSFLFASVKWGKSQEKLFLGISLWLSESFSVDFVCWFFHKEVYWFLLYFVQ